MEQVNRNSIYCDGIENVKDGHLIYTDELCQKARNKFNTNIPKVVELNDSEMIADQLINEIIQKAL